MVLPLGDGFYRWTPRQQEIFAHRLLRMIDIFSHLLSLLNSNAPDECALPAKAIFAIFTGNDASLVGGAIEDLLSNRRALQIIVENVVAALRTSRLHLLHTTPRGVRAVGQDRYHHTPTTSRE